MRDFAKDRALCDAATAGPWDQGNDEAGHEIDAPSQRNIGVFWKPADLWFAIEAREGWPIALAALERAVELLTDWGEMERIGLQFKYAGRAAARAAVLAAIGGSDG